VHPWGHGRKGMQAVMVGCSCGTWCSYTAGNVRLQASYVGRQGALVVVAVVAVVAEAATVVVVAVTSARDVKSVAGYGG
jgi:hypothetical protein